MKLAVESEPGKSRMVKALSCDIEPLMDSEASLLWLGNRTTAKTIVLFLHGGGYIAPLLPGHLEWCWRAFVSTGQEAREDVAVAILEYTLCPEAQYPIQLRQAASGLHHLLQSGRRLDDIVICGDSAGGNLAAQLAMHMCYAVPSVQPILATGRLKAVCLISPWLSMKTNHESFITNGSIDMLSAGTVSKSTKYLFRDYDARKGSSGYHDQAFPLDWDGPPVDKISTVTSRFYITVGEYEVFRDQAVQAVAKIRTTNPNLDVVFELQKDMAHDFILLEGQSGRSGECMKNMKRWILGVLSADEKPCTSL
ncbi:hypothetical protein NQ176_g768 [Zarea fungicola]|uniref:Uncharacterized protein n=1 Tax=Zarea fungicola TaxID=93591 RepID=A0ACC1NWA1_9HYPO|nr:hypothetical protein NQ176_g768 [Lecanicillium fungicola]